MSSRIGEVLSVQLWGESHGPMVGVTLDGLPAGFILDEEALAFFLRRRAARDNDITTSRLENDRPRIVSGLYRGRTTGYPLTALFENEETRSEDYAFLPDNPRPGHADYPASVRSGGFDDLRGGGHHSGRLSLPYAFAGGVAKQILAAAGMEVLARLAAAGDVRDVDLDPAEPDLAGLRAAGGRDIPTINGKAGEAMHAAIRCAKEAGDSLGGLVECVAIGVPAGLGAPYFNGVEAIAASHLFSIPAVKGVEFGSGFMAALKRGSEYNDPYTLVNGHIRTVTNHAGGLLGGLSTGMPVVVRVAFRPTPSIGMEQQTVSLSCKKETKLRVKGRHDPCIAVRAVPVVESAMSLALCDLWLQRRVNTAI